MKLWRHLLFKCLLIMSACLAIRGNGLRFDRLTIEDGLSQGSILSMAQDHEGFLWIGTYDGLNRYDGYNFLKFKHDPGDSTSIPGSSIRAICQDSKNRLWLGAQGGGLCRYNPESRTFTRFQLHPENPNQPGNGVLQIVAAGDALWIGTWREFGHFDPESGKFTVIPLGNGTRTVNAIYHDGDQLWLGMGNDFYQVPLGKPEEITPVRINPGPYMNGTKRATVILRDQYKKLWFGTDKGLIRFDAETGESEHFVNEPGNDRTLSDNHIETLLEDRQGVLWVGTRNGGLHAVVRQKAKDPVLFNRHTSKNVNAPGLNSSWILSFLEDSSGVLWVGTGGDGLGILTANGRNFRFYSNQGENRDKSINSVFKDKAGNLLVGMFSSGLHVMNAEGTKTWQYKHQANRPDSLSNNRITGIQVDESNRLWLATGDGVNTAQWDATPPEKMTFKKYRLDPNNPRSLPNNTARHLTLDSHGVVWIATYSGLCRYDQKTDDFTRFAPDPNRADSLSSNMAYHVMADRKNRIWVGTLSSGLNCMEPGKQSVEGGSFQIFKREVNNKGLSDNSVLSILEAGDGVIWAGTANGLNQYHENTQTFTHFFEKDGLANSVVYGMLEDHEGFLWISGNRGLTKFNPKTGATRTFSLRDGLQGLEFNGNVYHKADDGELFFGGTNGLTAFYPRKLVYGDHAPPVFLTDFFLLNRQAPLRTEDPSSPLQNHIDRTSSITLSHKQNFFSIRFAALNFENPAKNSYAYYLEGLNQNWMWVDSGNRMASYTNLSPGSYTFHVKAANSNNVWNEEGVSLKINVLPPPWRTWWAYTFYTLAGVLAAGYYVRAQKTKLAYEKAVNRHLMEMDRLNNDLNQKLERQVAERTTELQMSNRELANLERMAALINRETSLEPVLKEVLEQGVQLFPQAERGLILGGRDKEPFQVLAHKGFHPDGPCLGSANFDVVTQCYRDIAAELHPGIFLTGGEKTGMGNLQPPPRSMITMELSVGDMDVLMILASYDHNKGFTSSDGERLNRFREHAFSAVNKAYLLKELERRHRALLQHRDQLIQQEKMASLGTLTAGLAHEVRNPINFVNNFARLLLEVVEELKNESAWPSALDPYARDLSENAEMICKHGARVEDIVKSIVNISGGAGLELSTVQINKLVKKSVEMVTYVKRSRTNGNPNWIRLELDPSLTPFMGMPQSLNQALVNILNNALEAVDECDRESEVVLQTSMDKTWIIIKIRDNGPGVPPSQRSRLFTPFFTTRCDNSHLGLGLFTSYDIVVNQHYGEIEVTSVVDRFTEFVIRIPRVRPLVSPNEGLSQEAAVL